jgi:uncharacterized OB-fold protein
METDAVTTDAQRSPLPFRAGFLAGDLANAAEIRLGGSRCKACGIALFGKRHRCENCSSPDLDHVSFSPTGTIYTYTVQRYAPPPPHSLPVTPWHPRPIAWIDLDDNGPRILGPIACPPEQVSIGMAVRVDCQIGWIDATGADVMAYGFVPVAKAGADA